MGGRSIPSKMMEASNEERKAEKNNREYKDLDKEKWGFENDYFDKAVKTWLNNMDEEEKDGVKTYTGYRYEEINKYLRDGLYGTGEAPYLEEYIRNATKGLKKYVLDEDLKVYRKSSDDIFSKLGVKFDYGMSAQNFVNEIKGFANSVVKDKGFTSTSTRRDTWSGKVWFEIRVPKGTSSAYVDSISRNQGERELLLNRGTKFKIVDAYVRKGETYFDDDKPVVVLQVVRKRVGKRG